MGAARKEFLDSMAKVRGTFDGNDAQLVESLRALATAAADLAEFLDKKKDGAEG